MVSKNATDVTVLRSCKSSGFFPGKSLKSTSSHWLLKQGSVLLESDFNEQGAITARALRQLIRDLIEPHAGPEKNLGFVIKSSGAQQPLFDINSGRYYVDGLLAVNDPPHHYVERQDPADLFQKHHDHQIELY